mmetsp:Transcript_75955/g.201505  ORF Transcript_75955/g.201505 Transcript_75955/m.201505 type:complete len:269 (-) Transcript_75955:516-1322(-)
MVPDQREELAAPPAAPRALICPAEDEPLAAARDDGVPDADVGRGHTLQVIPRILRHHLDLGESRFHQHVARCRERRLEPNLRGRGGGPQRGQDARVEGHVGDQHEALARLVLLGFDVRQQLLRAERVVDVDRLRPPVVHDVVPLAAVGRGAQPVRGEDARGLRLPGRGKVELRPVVRDARCGSSLFAARGAEVVTAGRVQLVSAKVDVSCHRVVDPHRAGRGHGMRPVLDGGRAKLLILRAACYESAHRDLDVWIGVEASVKACQAPA